MRAEISNGGRASLFGFPDRTDATPIVAVQGLGFVGAAMAVAVASARNEAGMPAFRVVGVDLPTARGQERIAAINGGGFPFAIMDGLLKVKAREAYAAGNLVACSDPDVFGAAAVIIVDVPLDLLWSDDEVRSDLDSFRSAIATVGRSMAPDALVIIETTVPPGTTSAVAAPLLCEQLSRRGLPADRFMLAHSYERLMPGAAYFDSVVNMPRVYAGRDARSAEACERFLQTVIDTSRAPLTRVSSTTASETGKILENSFRAVTIALMEEWSSFAEAVGVDLFEVIGAIRDRPTHSNMRAPGFGVGGYCLTKDPLIGLVAAREIFKLDLGFPFSSLAVATNREMPRRALDRVRQLLGGTLCGRRILLLGVSYREDVGDTRSSPSEIFYRTATQAGAEVLVHDPLVTRWEEAGLVIPLRLPSPVGLDAIVLAVPHAAYRDFDYEAWLDGQCPLIFDGFNVLNRAQRARLRQLGCRVESIGRGKGL